MKNIILISIFLLLGLASFAQVGIKPGSVPPYESWSQMWNPSSVYYNTITASNVGTQRDTIASSTTTYFATTKVETGRLKGNSDTVYYNPLSGAGNSNLNFYFYAVKGASTAGTVFVQLQGSIDGFNFTNIIGDTATLTPTSTTAPVSCKFSLIYRDARFYRFAATAYSYAASCFAGYYVTKQDHIH